MRLSWNEGNVPNFHLSWNAPPVFTHRFLFIYIYAGGGIGAGGGSLVGGSEAAMDKRWRDLESLPPDRTVILRIIERLTGEPVWSRAAYVDEELELTDLEGEDHRIESRTVMPSHWMDLPRP